MKDDLCNILVEQGRLDKKFEISDHFLLDRVLDFINENDPEGKLSPTLKEGFELVRDWQMSYRSFIQHRIRTALNPFDPFDSDTLDRGHPETEEDRIENIRLLYEKTLHNLRSAFDDIYSEPNKAAFAIAEEFKDIMTRSRRDERRDLENQWNSFYRPMRTDIWPEDYGDSARQKDMLEKLKTPLHKLEALLDNEGFSF
jgi:hypothetical protein